MGEPQQAMAGCEEIQDELLPAPGGRAIGLVTLNSPKTLHALSLQMIDYLTSLLIHWAVDPRVAVVVIRGAGDKAFCAGGDVQRLYYAMRPTPGAPVVGADYPDTFFAHEYRLDYLLHKYPKPVLSWGHGLVMGGGLGLYYAASHRLATEGSRISSPEISIGLFPDAGATGLLAGMPGHLGLFAALTGAVHGGADALASGVATHGMHHSGQACLLKALTRVRWQDDHQRDHILLSATLDRVAEEVGTDLPEAGLTARSGIIMEALEGKTRYRDIVESILRLPERDPWFKKPATTLVSGCPISAGVIVEQLRLAPGLSLEDRFRMEMTIAAQCARHNDFPEGIRARLIDRDHQPTWSCQDVLHPPLAKVLEHFQPPWSRNPLSDLGARSISSQAETHTPNRDAQVAMEDP